LLNQLGAIAQSFRDFEDGVTGQEATRLLTNLDAVMQNLIQNGTEGFHKLREAAVAALSSGLIDQAGFDAVIQSWEDAQVVLGPLITEAEKINGEIAETDTAAGSAARTMNTELQPSLSTTAELAGNAIVQFEGMREALAALPAVVNIEIIVGLSGPGAGLITGGVGSISIRNSAGSFSSANSPTKSPSNTAKGTRFPGLPPRDTTRPSESRLGVPPPINELKDIGAAADSQRAAAAVLEDAANSWIDNINTFGDGFLGPRPGGGGGGGGSTAQDDFLATLAEIQAFFIQVNKAILGGIRGGLAFSTAGNAIPLGGPGQFINSQGGVLVEQVNLRGVWDFADPAAKREIVRQLREALAAFGDEVA
jgi:hypothetical protein